MSEWLNNKKRIHKIREVEKPCHKCGFCPYGQLVEEFPLYPEFDKPEFEGKLNDLGRQGKLNTGYSCLTFGHDCPVFYHAEFITEKK